MHMARGGKEGNNAFVADVSSYDNDWMQDECIIGKIMETETDTTLFDYLATIVNRGQSIITFLISKAHIAVKAGNAKTAAYFIEKANKFGGYGFNKLHEEALKA